MEWIEIMIAEDKERYRAVVKDMLVPFPVRVTGEAENGRELLMLLETKIPDVILLDLEMPVMDGNETFEVLRKKYPQLNVIILSTHYECELIEDYMERGAKGYIPKDYVTNAMLANAIMKVHAGGTFVYEKPQSSLHLTSDERVVMPLVFREYTDEQIARKIKVPEASVQHVRNTLYKKTGASGPVGFYKFAFTRGLQFLGIKKKGK